MDMRRLKTALVALCLVLATATGAQAQLLPDQYAALLNAPWPQALPPLPISSTAQPGPVPGCQRPSVDCIRRNIQELETLRDRLGCDHRAIFPSTYLQVQKLLLAHVLQDRQAFGDFSWISTSIDTNFVDWYLWTFQRYQQGLPVAPAWQVAFDQAMHGETNGVQDLGLDINAHVQNDMPFVEAHGGLRTRDGVSRKPSHDSFNLVMQQAFPHVLSQLALRYDPLASAADAVSPLGNVAGTELVKFWRESVWRNAELLIASGTPTDYRTVSANGVDPTSTAIHQSALLWARGLAALQVPGTRARRDAYCHTQLAALARQQLLTFGLPHAAAGDTGIVEAVAAVAGPTALPDLTLTLLDSAGRVVGRSAPTMVSSRQNVSIRLNQALRPGTYRLIARATYTNGTRLHQVERVDVSG